MAVFLERGTEISPGNRIRKQICFGPQWQIYSTSRDTMVLAVSTDLYMEWADRFQLAEGLFLPADRFENCRVFEAKQNYLIASLLHGPYPNDTLQIEAFSASLREARRKGSYVQGKDALYLEEYSMILPTDEQAPKVDILYSHWLTGGVDLEEASFGQLIKVMSWVSKERLLRCFELAGFSVDPVPSDCDDGDDTIILGADTLDPRKGRQGDIYFANNSGGSSCGRKAPAVNGVFSLPGRPALEQFFRENIIDIVLHREAYERMGISFPGATVLYGPPGSGKTYAVERLVEYLGWDRFSIDSGTIGSSYIHETSRRISEVFSQAMESAPSILVIDEMEAFLSERSGSPSGMHHMEEVAEFLRRIPEAVEKGVLIFAMTNMLDSIDPAILRRGRFDHIIKVDFATKEEMQAFLEKRFRELPVAEDVEIDTLAAGLAGHPMSDAAFVLKEAGRFAVRRGLEKMDAACFNDALDKLPKKETSRRIGF